MKKPDFVSSARRFIYEQSFCCDPDGASMDELRHDECILNAYLHDAYEAGAAAALKYCNDAGVMFVEDGPIDDLLREVLRVEA